MTNNNDEFMANEKITPRYGLHTCSSLKKYQLSNITSPSSIHKENPRNSTSASSIFNERHDLKSSNCEIEIYRDKSEINTHNKESILAKGVWSLFNKTNNISIENPSSQLDKKNERIINVKVLAARKISEDNGNKRPLKDITRQVLPSIAQLETPIQEIFKSLHISPNINISQRESKELLKRGSNIHEIFFRENPDIVQIAKHIELDGESEDKENENAGSLKLSEFSFSVDSFNMRYAEIIYPPSYYVELLDDPETDVTLEDFRMLLNNYTTLWNGEKDH